ncbi:hypothetical protein O6H91_09G108800 [Diphasiastrum complanatum]|uniref:Uncharacterized protein n=1 Tax=Diphasiastrum complanatum TaxID=34168 RepID=A0ACC2CT35_DIPCM|nr:hypothetical protein O6H91_09G108800 [Diphasiastrum complanatum]
MLEEAGFRNTSMLLQVGVGSSGAGLVAGRSHLVCFCCPSMHRLMAKLSFARCIISSSRLVLLEPSALQGVGGGHHARSQGVAAALEVPTDTIKKKERLSRQERATVVESYVRKHMASHQGQFPSLAAVLRETGGSRMIVKDILIELAGTMKLDDTMTMVDVKSNVLEAQESESAEKDLDPSTHDSSLTEPVSVSSTLSYGASMAEENISGADHETVVDVKEDSKNRIAKDHDEETIIKKLGNEGLSAVELGNERLTSKKDNSVNANKDERKSLWERLHANSSINTYQRNGSFVSESRAASCVSNIAKQAGGDLGTSYLGRNSETEDADFSSLDYPEATAANQDKKFVVKVGAGKEEITGRESVDSDSTKHVLFVRFLHPDATDGDLRAAFQDCGGISRARPVRSRKGSQSKYIYGFVDFDTAEGLKNALKKDVEIRGIRVETRPSTSRQSLDLYGSTSDVMAIRHAVSANGLGTSHISKPSQTDAILDEGYPVLLEDVPQEISFQVQEALSAHGEIISSYSKVRDSGNVSAFVSFKTEVAKESALAAHWIHLGGKPFRIQRLDSPKTTVVRISNIAAETNEEKIVNTCQLCGYVDSVKPRAAGVVDVCFHPNEIRHMIRILDRLNEVHIDKRRWRAQPAPRCSPKTLSEIRRSADGQKWLQNQQFHVVDNLEDSLKEALMHAEDLRELLSLQWSYSSSTASTNKINSLTSLLRGVAKS